MQKSAAGKVHSASPDWLGASRIVTSSYPSPDLWLSPMTEKSIDGTKVNVRSYRKPTARTVVICFDGCDPRYISHGLSAGLRPTIYKMMSEGLFAIAEAARPTLPNPNN